MTLYDIAEAKAHLSELVQKAMLNEEVVIARDNLPLVRLVPVEPIRATRLPGSAKGKIIAIASDFNNPLTDFQDYS
ncbi:MAG: type II toxin-antitoxin system prevent-host-death family antitoxin [Pseudomonadota bacterium]|nr:type II toxin-antitoxin system prevent-host-death family antitoxin [Pseudomonadota bacterium]